MAKTVWHINEEAFLIENYATMTIKELREGLLVLSPTRRRTDDSINAKIKRLKAENKIVVTKTEDAIKRSLEQRRSQNENTRQEFM